MICLFFSFFLLFRGQLHWHLGSGGSMGRGGKVDQRGEFLGAITEFQSYCLTPVGGHRPH